MPSKEINLFLNLISSEFCLYLLLTDLQPLKQRLYKNPFELTLVITDSSGGSGSLVVDRLKLQCIYPNPHAMLECHPKKIKLSDSAS